MSFDKIVSLLQEKDGFIITSHINPDGDAIGAELALALALEQMEKKVFICNRDEVPDEYLFLPRADWVKTEPPQDITGYDALLVLDCGNFKRVEVFAEEDWGLIVNIDHHASNTAFGGLRLLEPRASSTSEIIFTLLEALPVRITAEIATCIYTGLLTDTGSFHYDNTDARSFEIAARLVELGAHPADISRAVYESMSFHRIRLLGESLNTLESFNGGSITCMVVTQDMLRRNQAKAADTEEFVNHPRSIKSAKVAVFWREMERDFYKISLRSKVNVDVSGIAGKFGGGGHFHAAGAHLRGKLDELKKQVVGEVAKALQEFSDKES